MARDGVNIDLSGASVGTPVLIIRDRLCPRKTESSDFLGHAHVSTTEIYARIDDEMKRKALEDAYDSLAPEKMPDWREDRPLLAWLDSLGLIAER